MARNCVDCDLGFSYGLGEKEKLDIYGAQTLPGGNYYDAIIDLCYGRHGVLLNCKLHIDQCKAEVNMIKCTSPLNNTSCLPKHKSTIIL